MIPIEVSRRRPPRRLIQVISSDAGTIHAKAPQSTFPPRRNDAAIPTSAECARASPMNPRPFNTT